MLTCLLPRNDATGDGDFPGLGCHSDEEDDGVPDAGAARTEEEKAAAKRAAQLARTGLGEDEIERFTAMFETVRSCLSGTVRCCFVFCRCPVALNSQEAHAFHITPLQRLHSDKCLTSGMVFLCAESDG